jgi:hypothetical protein
MVEHFLASDAFLGTVADVYFPGARPELVRCGDFQTRVLIHRGRAVTGFHWFPFSHYPSEAEGPVRPVPYLRRAVLRTALLSDGVPVSASEIEVSPFIRWAEFESWQAFLAFARSRGARTSSLERSRRRLARDFGVLSFVAEDEDPRALELALRWKAEQHARTGERRLHARQDREIHSELARRGLMFASTLRAGQRVAAVVLWHLHERRCIGRLIAHDAALARHSPGAILLQRLLQHRFEAGDEEFDMLIGREPFKYHYATHARFLGPLGTEPRRDRWRRRARMRAGVFLARYPGIQVRARMVEASANRLIARLRR